MLEFYVDLIWAYFTGPRPPTLSGLRPWMVAPARCAARASPRVYSKGLEGPNPEVEHGTCVARRARELGDPAMPVEDLDGRAPALPLLHPAAERLDALGGRRRADPPALLRVARDLVPCHQLEDEVGRAACDLPQDLLNGWGDSRRPPRGHAAAQGNGQPVRSARLTLGTNTYVPRPCGFERERGDAWSATRPPSSTIVHLGDKAVKHFGTPLFAGLTIATILIVGARPWAGSRPTEEERRRRH